MPIMSCRSNGKPGYKYGESGHCYTYTPGNEQSRKQARSRAAKQGRAIEWRRHKSSLYESLSRIQVLLDKCK